MASADAEEPLTGQGPSAGGCAHPVQLVGRTDTVDLLTGELLGSVGSDDLPGGRLLVACGDRRVARCPTCSAVYRRDTYQLVRAGLAGGKGVPEAVAGHPCLFATLTPPSFGAVHTQRVRADGTQLRCRPRRAGGTCEHGRPLSCSTVHPAGDPVLGQPTCPDCYDYPGAVLWQAHAGRLWDRFTLGTRRHVATAAGVGVRGLARHARVSFVRVAEFQRRGLIHLHGPSSWLLPTTSSGRRDPGSRPNGEGSTCSSRLAGTPPSSSSSTTCSVGSSGSAGNI